MTFVSVSLEILTIAEFVLAPILCAYVIVTMMGWKHRARVAYLIMVAAFLIGLNKVIELFSLSMKDNQLLQLLQSLSWVMGAALFIFSLREIIHLTMEKKIELKVKGVK